MMEHLAQILLLLSLAIAVVVIFQRLHIPTSLGYLLVGIILGPYTLGPTLSVPEFDSIAEFGVVFLLFTIGLNFSLPQIHALRHQVLGLGTGQVVLTTLIIALVLWLGGFPGSAAFVFGAVFAQSSTTIIASLLKEQAEENTRHGRLGLAMSVFQDVTAVPFLVIIPVLASTVDIGLLAGALGWALAKAILALVLVILAGRLLLRPLFHLVAERGSLEIFTLAVLMVALLAAWTTNHLGLSLAFGGFLAGMMLGETEFRHQVESSVRPFRDVLLGMFFVGIGMRFDPAAIPPIWLWVVLGALLILVSKILIVAALLHRTRVDPYVGLRTGLLLSVGGEFGLALTAIAQDSGVIDMRLGQIAITSVLLAMIAGAILIRFNKNIASWLIRKPEAKQLPSTELPDVPEKQVVIGGYGRVGHTIAVLLHETGIPFVAFDCDPKRVAQGRSDGYAVSFGDISDPELLSAIHVERASLVVITVDCPGTALRTLSYLRASCPQVPVIARARDLESSTRLLEAGAAHAYPETIEASLRLGAAALEMLQVSSSSIDDVIQGVRDWGYKPVQEEEGEEKK
ncbi:cation:proton antiporter [Microbulbifer thermotolerans]|uniref:Cation:proton antiporter n=1 Tax=Microbulbifer thermotolerans TaxID=252514 RepID=A0A143HR34_MICTH|nr:cation:proton antiporter [Microbulbifer thermotolerans]AMX04158.1 sodium:proton exchanger [Microbulbifer thermotolerans]MCX2780364.1 cation:proton antiporter [Microbulbifer thermotolerans]MCX2802197.1 cation:proton antiporter [Microbulbifer thermotolerans]MCX2805964.1 cation:proton antiporter [Microbulbifer thermotolerans]MCX2836260.1 cation:proton antiporter [Microbulbifer thermotolerans]